ncbi:MAG: glycosyltransferase family 2 protein [Verrucomicrobiota bacterium]|jgi:hypothetical protein
MLNQDPGTGANPAISVVCSCYNHGRFIGAFLEAMAAQTDGRFEVIIIDDASGDDSLAVIKACHDPRIKLVARERNRGYCASLNDGIRLARADVVAFLASDDLFHPRYVERVLAAFGANPSAAAVYVELERMSPEGVSLGEVGRLPAAATRWEILRRSFLGKNQLPSPGMAVRRELARDILLPEGTVQYSDWMLQNRVLMHGEVVMIEEPLVRYRVSAASLSARSVGSVARDLLETRIMMDDFLRIQAITFWAQVFPVEIAPFAALPDRHLPYVLGRIALLSDIPEKRCWGYETIMRHLSLPGIAESLQALASFTHKDLMALAPTDVPEHIEEMRLLRRKARHLRRWVMVLVSALALALYALCK